VTDALPTEVAMVARLIQRFIDDDAAWDEFIDIFAGLPGNF
jgi:hypothetical protein